MFYLVTSQNHAPISMKSLQTKILSILNLNWILLCSVLRPLQHSIGYKP